MATNPPNDPEGDAADAPQDAYEQWLAVPGNARYAKKLRDEAAGYRLGSRGREAAAAKALAERLGEELPANATEPPDLLAMIERLAPEKQQAEVKARDVTIRSLKLDLGLERAFRQH